MKPIRTRRPAHAVVGRVHSPTVESTTPGRPPPVRVRSLVSVVEIPRRRFGAGRSGEFAVTSGCTTFDGRGRRIRSTLWPSPASQLRRRWSCLGVDGNRRRRVRRHSDRTISVPSPTISRSTPSRKRDCELPSGRTLTHAALRLKTRVVPLQFPACYDKVDTVRRGSLPDLPADNPIHPRQESRERG